MSARDDWISCIAHIWKVCCEYWICDSGRQGKREKFLPLFLWKAPTRKKRLMPPRRLHPNSIPPEITCVYIQKKRRHRFLCMIVEPLCCTVCQTTGSNRADIFIELNFWIVGGIYLTIVGESCGQVYEGAGNLFRNACKILRCACRYSGIWLGVWKVHFLHIADHFLRQRRITNQWWNF